MFKVSKINVLILILILTFTKAAANTHREVRAAWLTTAYRLDWPQTLVRSDKDVKKQKEELIAILDQLKAAKFNTILFQVRHKGTLLYPSNIEPYSRALASTKNNNPLYNPLQFAIEECHKRGMECHAWFITLPADDLPKNIASRYPNKNRHLIKYKRNSFLDPSHPNTKHYLSEVIQEVVDNYDIDGVHLDYLRYPENITTFPGDRRHKREAKKQPLADWRRDNITQILEYIYLEVKASKPWVKVSVSPVGKHSDTSRYSSKGWNAFDEVYQDVFKWMKEGIVDQIYPMIYFQGDNFYPFVLDWNENKYNCQVIPGLGIYFLVEKGREWSINEVKRQIYFSRDNKLDGLAYFRTEFLLKNTKGVFDELKQIHYTNEILPPVLSGAQLMPTAPQKIQLILNDEKAVLSWDDNEVADTSYMIYFSKTYPVDTTNPENILATKIKGNTFSILPTTPFEHYGYYAVTAIDRFGNESEAIQLKPKQDIAYQK